MRKSIIIIAIIISLMLSLLYLTHLYYGKKTIYIAIASTFSGAKAFYGNEMLKGIQLYVDQINSSGGVKGHQIKLLAFDDKGTPEGAVDAATQIVRNKDILFVLGHYFSACCTATASIYENNMIPSITSSATSDEIPITNEWLFRTVPPNAYQSDFLAAYAQSALNIQTASIIYDTDAYGKNLAAVFNEKAVERGIEIVQTYPLHSNNDTIDDQIEQIVNAISTHRLKPEMFFLATHALESVKLVVGLREKQLNQVIMGADSLATPVFIDGFKAYPKEKDSPGFYSNGIYSVSPFLPFFSKKSNLLFEINYDKAYHENPSLISMTSYDLAHVAFDALNKIEMQGSVRKQRKEFKNALGTFYDKYHCVEGLTGRIFFDAVGDMKKSMIVTQLNNGQYTPAFHQYIAISLEDIHGNLIQKAINNDMMANDYEYFAKTQLINVGIDHIKINQIHSKKNTFHASFNLWFRFQGQFQPELIEFINSDSPVLLKNPKKSIDKQGIITLLYTVDSVFANAFNLKQYPMDRQTLTICFRDKGETENKLLFAIDKQDYITLELNSENWLPIHAVPYLNKDPFSGVRLNESSEFAVDIRIQRKLNFQEKQIFIAVIFLSLLSCFSYFVPIQRVTILLIFNMLLLVVNAVCHLYFKLPIYVLTFSEMLFIVLYGFIGITVMFQVGLIYLTANHYKQSLTLYKTIGKTVCLITMIILSYYVIQCYVSM